MPASAAHTPQSDLDDDAAAAARTSTGGGAGAGGHAMPATRHRVHSSSSRNDDFVATRANAEDGCSFAASASVQGLCCVMSCDVLIRKVCVVTCRVMYYHKDY